MISLPEASPPGDPNHTDGLPEDAAGRQAPPPFRRAMLVVDVQPTFCEGGELAINGGNAVAERIAAFLGANRARYDVVISTQDWHINPGEHFSTTPDYVNSWPVHAVAYSLSAQLHPALDSVPFDDGVKKGQFSHGYSGFDGVNNDERPLEEILRAWGVTAIDVCGLALSHCVKVTALDAKSLGFDVRVLADLSLPVSPELGAAAVRELAAAGVELAVSSAPDRVLAFSDPAAQPVAPAAAPRRESVSALSALADSETTTPSGDGTDGFDASGEPEASPFPEPAAPRVPSKRRKRAGDITKPAALFVVAVLVAGGVAVGAHRIATRRAEAATLADTVAAAEQSAAALEASRAVLDGHVASARDLVDAMGDQIADPETLTRLNEAVAGAQAVLDAEAPSVSWETRADAELAVETSAAHMASKQAALDELLVAKRALAASHSTYLVEQAEAELAEANEQAQAALDEAAQYGAASDAADAPGGDLAANLDTALEELERLTASSEQDQP